MPDDQTGESAAAAPAALTREDMQSLLEEQQTAFNEKLETLATAIAPEEPPESDTVVTTNEKGKYVGDTWQPQTYNDLFEKVVEVVKQNVPNASVDKVVEGVMSRLQLNQDDEQTRLAEADKVIDQEIAGIRKEDKALDEGAVLRFIGDWNQKHTSQISSFKDGYELYSTKAPADKREKAPSKVSIVGSPSVGEVEEKEQKFYRTVDEAMQAELYALKQEGQS